MVSRGTSVVLELLTPIPKSAIYLSQIAGFFQPDICWIVGSVTGFRITAISVIYNRYQNRWNWVWVTLTYNASVALFQLAKSDFLSLDCEVINLPG